MTRWSFLKEPRWLGLIAMMVAASITCVLLGLWQFGRYEDRASEVDQINAAWDHPSAPVEEILVPEPESFTVPSRSQWRSTSLTGHYIPGSQIQLRNRPVGGDNAVHLIALFETTVGGDRAIAIVNRGWIPLAQADGDVGLAGVIPELPTGQTTLTVRARPEEAAFDRSPAPGMTYTLNTDQVWDAALPQIRESNPAIATEAGQAFRIDGRFEAAPGQIGSDDDAAPRPFPQPSVRMGSHLSYAIQWWIFAAAALSVVPILARREVLESDWVIDGVDLRDLDLTEDERRDLGLTASRSKVNGRYQVTPGSDEDIEDQLLDGQASEMRSR